MQFTKSFIRAKKSIFMLQFLSLHKRFIIIFGILSIVIVGMLLTLPIVIHKSNHKTQLDTLANPLARIQFLKKIKVVTHNNSTAYFVYRGQPMGFHYDLIKAFAKSKGWQFEIITEDNLQKAIEMLNDGKAELVAMDITHTKSREKTIQFTESVGYNRQVLVQRKQYGRQKLDTVIFAKNIRALKNQDIYIQNGTVFKENLMHMKDNSNINFNIIEDDMHTMEELILMVARGEIDFTVCDERVAKANSTSISKIDFSMAMSVQQTLAWAVPMGADSLLKIVNNWLVDFKKTRKFAHLRSKYFTTKKNSFYTDSDFIPVRGGQLSPYDELFKKYAQEIDWDWRLLAAVIYQESRFNAEVTSWAGAMGLMQIMPTPATKFGLSAPYDPEENIKAGVKYLSLLLKRFNNPEISKEEQIKFVLASYNVGFGHVVDARNLAEKYHQNPNVWTHSVDQYMILKSNPKYYNDPVVKYGYCRGQDNYNYVVKIFAYYHDYKNVLN